MKTPAASTTLFVRAGLLAVALLAAAPGCGGGPVASTTRAQTPVADPVRAHKAVMVTGAAAQPEWAPEAKAMADRLVEKLERLKLFSAVIDEKAGKRSLTDLEMIITVTDLVKVNAGQRKARGDDAGPVRVVIQMEIKNRANGADLGRAIIRAEGFEGPQGGTTEDAADRVLEAVAALVAGRSPD